MNFQSIRSLAKPLLFWTILLCICIEVVLHYKLCDLPYKFLNHTAGPVHKLGQYSKDEVIPKNYLAIVGDSNVYGFGPWLYDNSWSMEQPSFASNHLLYASLKKRCCLVRLSGLWIARFFTYHGLRVANAQKLMDLVKN